MWSTWVDSHGDRDGIPVCNRQLCRLQTRIACWRGEPEDPQTSNVASSGLAEDGLVLRKSSIYSGSVECLPAVTVVVPTSPWTGAGCAVGLGRWMGFLQPQGPTNDSSSGLVERGRRTEGEKSW